jgi:multidrug efflux pump
MVFGVNVDFVGRSVEIGGPSTQWWTQLATAVAGGLAFATLLTLVMTPSLRLLGEHAGARFRRLRGRFTQPAEA